MRIYCACVPSTYKSQTTLGGGHYYHQPYFREEETEV